MKYNTIVIFLIVEKSFVGYFKNILEAYDNMAVLTKVGSTGDLFSLSIAPGCELLVKGVLNDLAETISIRYL